jgi:hypothetical protein
MQNRLVLFGVAIAAIAAVVVLTLTLRPTASDAQGFEVPRTADGKPDLNGIWQAVNAANFDIQDHPASAGPFPVMLGASGAVPAGVGIVEGNEIPYTPAALEQKKANYETRMQVDPFDLKIGDPEAKCYMPGVPRANYMPFPFQIVQGTDKILIAYEFDYASRVVYMTDVGESPVDTWMGHSLGHWDGDTLVIDVSANMAETWFDRVGNFHSGQMKVTERWTRTSPDHLHYEATIDDPEVFTRTWKMSFPLYRRIEPNAEINEFRCVEFAEPFLLGTLSQPPLK